MLTAVDGGRERLTALGIPAHPDGLEGVLIHPGRVTSADVLLVMTQSADARYTRDMSQAGVPDPNVRASDADRERIVEQLRQHTADGRLTMDEFDERLDAAYAAKTYGELRS